ncbi:MAG: hypothetical protein KUG77_18415 [Nannocystaceae bacterium]|nr:hypothetical protein [Nannocystaceae bacterium]
MSSARVRFSRLGATLMGGLMMLVQPQSAEAEPPTAADFTIKYWTTDEDGNRGRQMTENDLRGYVNKARCECGQAVSARVRLQSSEARDAVRVRTLIGTRCNEAESGNNIQAQLCALAIEDFTNAYTRNVDFNFNPLWLASGVARDSARPIAEAEAAAGCESQEGDGGIWICVESNNETSCQSEEFVVTGTQTEITDDNGAGIALSVDFRAPTITATNFRASGGDGSVVIKWDNDTSSDIQGYRALCANADGTPVDGKGFKISSVTAENRGTVYYTADNLCPDGPFDQIDVDPNPDPILPEDSGTDTDGGTGGDTDGASTGAAGLGAAPEVAHGGMVDCCTAGECTDNTCIAAVSAVEGDCAEGWSETCAILAADFCEVCDGDGNCCAENTSPSCADSACTLAVCEQKDFAYCCADRWDADCANEAKSGVCDVCDEGTTGGSGMTSGAPTTGTTTTSGSGTDTDTDAGTDTDGLDTSGIESLDWDYVCSDFIAANASTARINGLTNDLDYQVLLVAFDYAGNPVSASEVFTATPRETTDLWEQCDAQGEICGTGGFCSCTTDGPSRQDTSWLLLTGLLGLVGRRRRAGGRA